jgi:hypothetical protein
LLVHDSICLLTVNCLDDHALLKDVRVYRLAGEFNMRGLRFRCGDKLEKQLGGDWSDDEFVECIREVYEYTSVDDTDGLRCAVLETAKHNARELIEEAPFQQLIREGGDFALDFLESIIPHLPPYKDRA